ncbi:MAG: 3-deoxy-manno-octulosonate cytidylyltransferase [Pseudomonadota bacterium]
MSDTAIIIPSRIGSVRLQKKPLKMIGNMTMIEHVVHRARESGAGDVFVATDSDEIAEKARIAGATPVLVTKDVAQGTDRVWEALKAMDPGKNYKYIVNLQGDLPLVNPQIITDLVKALKNTDADIVTPVIKEQAETPNNPGNVKAIMGAKNKALYFSRQHIPTHSDWFWYHIGIYGFKRDSLENFVNLPQSHTELMEKLEQLRALENGMTIELCIANENAVSVDTQEDLDKVIALYNKKFT